MLRVMCEFGGIIPDESGWAEFCKSPELFDALDAKCKAIASAACEASSADPMENPPFIGEAVTGNFTSVGFVNVASPHGYNAKERILDNIGAGG